MIETADQFLEFMQHIDSPAVGMNFDIGHSYCVGDDPATTIPRVAKYIRHIHLEDIAATRVHHHLVPGEGAIDFAAVLRAIRAIEYHGWVTIELYPYIDDPDDAARWARQHIPENPGDPMNTFAPTYSLHVCSNLPTAIADICLGRAGRRLLALAGAGIRSLCCCRRRRCCVRRAWLERYFDFVRDPWTVPFRPLPSGRVSPGQAARFGRGLRSVAGVLLALAAGTTSLLVALCLTAAILAYDWLAQTHLGGAHLGGGTCRFLNVLLGVSACGLFLWLCGWIRPWLLGCTLLD